MRARIQRWGNSLAIRLPKPLAEKAGLNQQVEVEISFVEESQVVTLSPRPLFILEELLAQVTDENLHSEIDFGSPGGNNFAG